MADLVVKDLDELASNLDSIIDAFDGAENLQDDDKGLWGQLNANLSMGDFAYNWKIHRGKITDSLKSFRDKVKQVDDAWNKGDLKLAQSLDQKS